MRVLTTRAAAAAKLLALIALFNCHAYTQDTANVTIHVSVVDSTLTLKDVPKFAISIGSVADPTATVNRVVTGADGRAVATLPPGEYLAVSERPLEFDGKRFTWEQRFVVKEGAATTVDLSSDNAVIAALALVETPRRRVSEEGELFKTLRDGVVTIEGEIGSGTGFLFDSSGLILTNQHVVSKSNEIRVRFDKKTAVRARLLAEDPERDIAVLQVNISPCSDCRTLELANNSADSPSVVEGERVFTIGSPLFQDKILTSGIVSKVEERAIISDININPGNSGGPLFNSLGEVVGLTTFGVKADGGPGIAGIVRIEQAAELIAKARESAAGRSAPSADLAPNMPEGTFPIETIKTAMDVKKFSQKPYKDDVKDYQINYFTPVFKFYVSEKDRLDSLKKREKRNKDKGVENTADRFRDLKNWGEYAGELRPVVDILALPEVTITGKSMFLGIVGAAAGLPVPPDMKFKADFFQMRLICDREEVAPLLRKKVEFGADLQSYYKVKTRYTYAGVYTYPFETFEPGKCGQLRLEVYSEEDPEKAIIAVIRPETKAKIWADFADYRNQQAAKP